MLGIDKKQLSAAMKEMEFVKEFLAEKIAEAAGNGGGKAIMDMAGLRETVMARAVMAMDAMYPDKNQRIDVANDLRKIIPNLWDIVEVEDAEFRKELFEAFKAADPLAATAAVSKEPIDLLIGEVISIMRKHASDEVGDNAEVAVICTLRVIYDHLPRQLALWEARDWNGLMATFQEEEVALLCAMGEAFTPIAKAS